MSSVSDNIANWGDDIRTLAEKLGVDEAALHAVAAAEVGAIPTNAGLPTIRFEVHVCLRRCDKPGLRDVLQLRDAPNAWHRDAQWYSTGGSWQRVHTDNQGTEWAALAAACEVDPKAALESASIGVGQLMGWHWELLGYDSPQTMYARAMRGVPVQIKQWGKYLERDHKGAMIDALIHHDWEAFTRLYNGSGQVEYYSKAIEKHFTEAAELLK